MLTTEFDYLEKMLTNDNVANSRLSQENPSSKLFWVDNIQFPAHYKKSAKTNKRQYILTKKFNLKFRRKSYQGLPRFQRDAVTHQGISIISEG